MAVDSVQLASAAASGVVATYFRPADQFVYHVGNAAYEAWDDTHYANYTTAATQQGTSMRWKATRPAGVTVPFSIVWRRVVSATLASDTVIATAAGAQLVPDAAPGASGGLPTTDASNRVTANTTQFAGQTITAAAGVTVPASIGTSTYSGGAVSSVTGNVGGNVVGSVGSVAAGGIAAASFAADALTASALAADAVTEIQSGLATTSGLSTVNSNVSAVGSAVVALGTPAHAGDAMTLTSGERTSIGTAVWASTTRTLSSFGSLVADVAAAVWAAVARTLTSGGGGSAPTAEEIDDQLSGTHGSGAWGGTTGTGNTAVDHNTGGADNLRLTVNGAGIDGADVRAYLAADFAAGHYGASYIKGQTRTGPVSGVAGRMPIPMYLASGNTYTIAFAKPGYLETATASLTI